MTQTIRVISDDREFAALEGPWNALVSDVADPNVFLTHTWLYSWWMAYRPRAALRIVVVEQDGRLVGIAPMMLTREGVAGRLLRRLRFVGDGTSETDHMNLIADASDRERVVSMLLGAIQALPWQLAHFNQMPESSQNTQQLLRFADQQGWYTKTLASPCPRCLLPSAPEDLLKSLPSRLRTAIRSARRELTNGHVVEFGMHSQPDELPAALEALYRNHASRWQAKGETGVFVDPRKRRFYLELGRKLLETGALRFFYLKVDGKVIAQQFCFNHAGSVYLLQEGFDFAWSKHNVGNLLRWMVLEHLIARGTCIYDFLAGVTRHKRQWSNDVANDLLIRSFRPSWLGAMAHRVDRLRARLQTVAADPAAESA